MPKFFYTGTIFNNGPVKESIPVYVFTPGRDLKRGWWCEIVNHRTQFKMIWEAVIGSRELTISVPRTVALEDFAAKMRFKKLRLFTHDISESSYYVVNAMLDFDEITVLHSERLTSTTRARITQKQLNYLAKNGMTTSEILSQHAVTLMINPDGGSFSLQP